MTEAASTAPSRAFANAKPRTPGLPYLNVQIGIVIVAILAALLWRFGFPLLIFVAARAEAPGRLGAAFRWLGLTSYAVYTLHAPTGILVYQVLRRTGIIDVWYSAPYSGFVFLAFIAIMASFAISFCIFLQNVI